MRAIGKQAYGSIVHTNPTAIVHTIEPAREAMPMERVVKLFTKDFEEICRSSARAFRASQFSLNGSLKVK